MPTAPYSLQPEPMQKGWLERHPLWKIPLGILILFSLVVVGAAPNIIHWVAIRHSDVYRQVMARAQMHPALRQQLGEPVRPGWLVYGDYRVRGGAGIAKLSIPVSGPRGKATIHVVATRGMGMWWYQTLTAEVEGRPTPIGLLTGPAGAP
ncbi:MAG TPA: cytochrome c oxidase assembly factor Coa1 family protein [Candidatus Sulfotelmatobacter sp.]|jgi:hypothetical protein